METIDEMRERHKSEIVGLQNNCEHDLETITFEVCKICDKRDDIIEDGFGMVCSAWCSECGQKSMAIIRPGKVQCNNCG